jgi:putative colanic acid biosynthesis UDP-glucose lipid carrier transferase
MALRSGVSNRSVSPIHGRVMTRTTGIGAKSGRLSAFMQATDAALIGISLALSAWLHDQPWSDRHVGAILAAIVAFVVAAHFFDVYRSWRGSSIRRELMSLLWAWALTSVVLMFIAYVTETSVAYPRRTFLTWFMLTPLMLIVWRGWMQTILALARHQGLNTRNVAIVGARELGSYLARSILDAPWMGLNPIGFYDDRRLAGDRPLVRDPIEVIGSLDALVKHAHEGRVDIVYITLPMRAEARIQDLVARLSDTTASVHLVPDFFIFDLLNASWGTIGDLPVVSISETPFYGVDGVVKRLEDLVLSTFILSLIAIPMALIAVGVKLSSPGPIIFRQTRYGLNGQKIEVWKFRTMTVCEDGPVVVQARPDDPRITRFGAFLRRFSLDELPQFLNVMQGQMSIVGPRPYAIAHNEQYRKLISRFMLRHKVKPGITGLAQVRGWRGAIDSIDQMQEKVNYDLAYIHNWSLWLDLKIIILTAFGAFFSRATS